MRRTTMPDWQMETRILQALDEGGTTTRELLRRMREAGLPDTYANERQVARLLTAMRKAGRVKLRRWCSSRYITQAWAIVL